MDITREPESSAGMNIAAQTAHGWLWCDATCFTEIVTVSMAVLSHLHRQPIEPSVIQPARANACAYSERCARNTSLAACRMIVCAALHTGAETFIAGERKADPDGHVRRSATELLAATRAARSNPPSRACATACTCCGGETRTAPVVSFSGERAASTSWNR
jgi:hypothetical protein